MFRENSSLSSFTSQKKNKKEEEEPCYDSIKNLVLKYTREVKFWWVKDLLWWVKELKIFIKISLFYFFLYYVTVKLSLWMKSPEVNPPKKETYYGL